MSELGDAKRRIGELERQVAALEAQPEDGRASRYSTDPRLNRLLGDPLVLARFRRCPRPGSERAYLVRQPRRTRLNAADFIGTDCLASMHPDDRERYRAVFEKVGSVTSRPSSRFVHQRLLVGFTLGAGAGRRNVVFMLVSSTDVSLQKEQEQALRERETSARLSLLASGVGTWTYWPAKDELYWDTALCEIFGVEPRSAHEP